MNILYTPMSYATPDKPHILPICSYVRSRSYDMYGIWHHTAVNNVSTRGFAGGLEVAGRRLAFAQNVGDGVVKDGSKT